MKKLLLYFISFLSLFIFVGCSNSNDTIVDNIENVLTTQFTSPDEELVTLYLENMTVIGNGNTDESPKDSSDLDHYLENTYQQYFSEESYETFISQDGLLYQFLAESAGYDMSVDAIDVTESDGTYEFSVIVNFQKENETENQATVTGTVGVDDNGKITRINYLDDGGLYNSLQGLS